MCVMCIMFRIISLEQIFSCDAQSIRTVFGVPKRSYLDLACVQRPQHYNCNAMYSLVKWNWHFCGKIFQDMWDMKQSYCYWMTFCEFLIGLFLGVLDLWICWPQYMLSLFGSHLLQCSMLTVTKCWLMKYCDFTTALYCGRYFDHTWEMYKLIILYNFCLHFYVVQNWNIRNFFVWFLVKQRDCSHITQGTVCKISLPQSL